MLSLKVQQFNGILSCSNSLPTSSRKDTVLPLQSIPATRSLAMMNENMTFLICLSYETEQLSYIFTLCSCYLN